MLAIILISFTLNWTLHVEKCSPTRLLLSQCSRIRQSKFRLVWSI